MQYSNTCSPHMGIISLHISMHIVVGIAIFYHLAQTGFDIFCDGMLLKIGYTLSSPPEAMCPRR
jgi:hypothetical protein